jgi:uncharacterized membrane protein YadS
MSGERPTGVAALYKTEDYWAIWLGFAIILVTMGFFFTGGTLKEIAVTPGEWSRFAALGADLGKHGWSYLVLFISFGAVFSLSMVTMGRSLRQFVPGFVILFVGSLAIFYLAGWSMMKKADLGAPLLALLIGLIIGNIKAMPEWFKTSLRTEYYIKTGIVLLGATLPLTLIYTAGPIAFFQATIVSVTTWSTIFLAATRLFKLDPRFGAVLGTGGAVCGVSGSIAIGGAVRAEKDHIAIGIAVVSVWAIVMILVLTALCKWLVPAPITPGVAGAWIGTSEYADAAGFAVVAELAQEHGEAPIHTFTLMKVIGRDIWIGIWAFVLSIISVVFWEKRDRTDRAVGVGVVWQRFPKFVLGFFAASITISIISARTPADHVGEVGFAGVYKTKASKQKFSADFAGYVVPGSLAPRMTVDHGVKKLRFKGEMSLADLKLATAAARTRDQRLALTQLQHQSDWFASVLKPLAIGPIKKLRSWCFVLCFLCIGLSTRFKELATFGMKPFYAFTIGVAINVPLGYILSRYVFGSYWSGI